MILDADLAGIYQVPTKVLNQAVKRNREKFPQDFLFELTRDEAEETRRLRSQFVTLKAGRGQHRQFLPYAFTEHGAIMAATVLHSRRAVQMSVFVVRSFIKMRAALSKSWELSQQLALLDQELKIRMNVHEAAIVDVLQRIMKILDPPPEPPGPPPPEMGFQVKEDSVPYRVRKKPVRQT